MSSGQEVCVRCVPCLKLDTSHTDPWSSPRPAPPESYPSQFKAMVFQLPRSKIRSHSRLVSSLSLLFSIQSSGFYLQNIFTMWPFLTSSTITSLDYCNSLLIGVPAFPASIFGVTPTSTHSLFSIQEGICYNINQIMSFLCLKFLQAFPARTMPKG